MKLCSHLNIMSGEVVVFAPDFIEESSAGIHRFEAVGFYEITASEKTVYVHQCILNTEEELQEFTAAMRAAYSAHCALRGRKADSMLFPQQPTPIKE